MTLDPLAACGVFGTLVTIISFIWAILVARQKLLVYEFTAPLPLAKSIHESERYRLSIIHEREGASPVAVKGAYISFVKLMNLGKETVQWSDVASPLKLEVSNTKVLDVTCANVSRGSIDFKVSAFEEINASTTTVLITFKFLDYNDWGVIQVLTETQDVHLKVTGDIIGMPGSIRRRNKFGMSIEPTKITRTAIAVPRRNSFKVNINLIEFSIFTFIIFLYVLSFVGVFYLFVDWFGYRDWIISLIFFLMPIGALALPTAILIAVLRPRTSRWPRILILPKWLHNQYQHLGYVPLSLSSLLSITTTVRRN